MQSKSSINKLILLLKVSFKKVSRKQRQYFHEGMKRLKVTN